GAERLPLRLQELGDVTDEYGDLASERLGRVRARVLAPVAQDARVDGGRQAGGGSELAEHHAAVEDVVRHDRLDVVERPIDVRELERGCERGDLGPGPDPRRDL